MTNRERIDAILHDRQADRLPVVHFGFWRETLEKWALEGHIPCAWARDWRDGNEVDARITELLGFDMNWYRTAGRFNGLDPAFEPQVLETLPNGFVKKRTALGTVVLEKPGTVSIPPETDHLLKDRDSWRREYKPRLQFSMERIAGSILAYADRRDDAQPLGLHCGSIFGVVRNWLGLEGLSYLCADDEELLAEIIETVGTLCYQVAKAVLERGVVFDFGHFWEDICCKNGPLVLPGVFDEMAAPQYRRITALLSGYGIDIVSVDCDGWIDRLMPTWINSGVNTMFPIEVGTWEASIAPWRARYGRGLRGVGGMNKTVFADDKAAVDREIDRLLPLVALGGYIPCPDHRIAPDALWENVRHYCERMRAVFR